MPSSGNHHLNMYCFLDDSLKEALRLNMLSQEDTFKNQVQELHRLHQIQTMLMKNSQMKGVVTGQSVDCTSQGMLQRPLRNINQPFINKRDGWGTRENPVQVDDVYCSGDTESSMDEVNLSLSIGRNTKRKRGGRDIFSENFNSVSFQEIIDLEESIHTDLDGKFEPGNLQVNKSNCISGNDTSKDVVMIMRSDSLADEGKTYADQNSAGATKCLGEVSGVGGILPPLTTVLTSHEELFFDLNKPPVDESDFNPKSLELMESSSYGLTERVAADIRKDLTPDGGTSWRISDYNCSNEVSGVTQQDNLYTVMMASGCTKSSTNSQHENLGFGSTFLRSEEGQTDVGVNNKVTSDQKAVFSNLCSRVDIVEDSDSSRASWKTGQSGIYTVKSDLSHANPSPNSESSENESPSPDESKCRSSDEKREEGLPQEDSLLQRGAESLMCLLLASSRGEQGSNAAEVDNANEFRDGNKKMDKPQCSSDSYESTVLKQLESSKEDYCVSSTPMEMVFSDNKDFGVKVRRGRRMKDFQKDILPSLASLSRQEISEDVRLMDGIIRSREYKRLRSQMAKVQNQKWFTPVRSRRSKRNYVGRKFS